MGPPRCQHRLPALPPARTTPASQHACRIVGQAVRAPDGHEVDHAAALDPEHVLGEQVGPDVGHGLGCVNSVRTLGSMAAGPGQPRGEEPLDGAVVVADRGRQVAEPGGPVPDRGQLYGVLHQATVRRGAGRGAAPRRRRGSAAGCGHPRTLGAVAGRGVQERDRDLLVGQRAVQAEQREQLGPRPCGSPRWRSCRAWRTTTSPIRSSTCGATGPNQPCGDGLLPAEDPGPLPHPLPPGGEHVGARRRPRSSSCSAPELAADVPHARRQLGVMGQVDAQRVRGVDHAVVGGDEDGGVRRARAATSRPIARSISSSSSPHSQDWQPCTWPTLSSSPQ